MVFVPFPDFEDDDFDDDDLDDDEFDDDGIAAAFTKPLPQADRLWRHPSEIGFAKAAEARARVDAPSPIVIRPSGWRTVTVGVGGGLAGALATMGILAGFGTFADTPPAPEIQTAAVVIEPSPTIPNPGTIQLSVDVPEMTRKVAPAIVRVEADTPTATSIGSAIAFRADGHFLTSADLVRDADRVFVIVSGSRTEATVIGADPFSNIAVLRVTGLSMVPPTIGDPTSLVTGSKSVVISVVSNGEVKPSPAEGVITVGRRIELPDGRILSNLIQTDATMTPGVRGGALLDSEGRLIGIMSTVVDDEAGSGSVGLATPIDLAIDLAEDYITYGEASSSWLGIVGSTLRDDTAESLGVPTGGIVINAVRSDSPAKNAGLRRDDIITHIDQQPVDSLTTFIMIMRQLDPGELIHIEKISDGQAVQLIAVVGDPPPGEGGTFR